MNPPDLDTQIDQLHTELEARERDARAAELRLQRLDLPPGSLGPRSYGQLPQLRTLTARAMVSRRDPALAMLLGLPVPRPGYEQEAAAAERAAAIQRMQQATAEARKRNQQAADRRFRQQLAGVDAWGRPRWQR
jgi:hypothetical protein